MTAKRISAFMAVVALLLAMACGAQAQRRITPVEPTPGTKGTPVEKKKSTEVDRSRLQEQKDANGNIILVDTVTGQEWVDTTVVKKKFMIYPRIYQVAAGVNLWDPLMRILGQSYGVASVWGELNMHNRYFPTAEIGLGTADITPDEGNYTFKSPMAPFIKVGINYNVFYNSDPRYKFLVGVRYGFTPFSYRVTGTLTDDYWGTSTPVDIPRQNSTAGYFEFLAGVRVNIIGNFSLGWDLRFHTILHESKATYGKPMYIPGYGKRNGSLTGSFSISYTFELNHPAPAEVNTKNEP